jgi:hypothetical protein
LANEQKKKKKKKILCGFFIYFKLVKLWPLMWLKGFDNNNKKGTKQKYIPTIVESIP